MAMDTISEDNSGRISSGSGGYAPKRSAAVMRDFEVPRAGPFFQHDDRRGDAGDYHKRVRRGWNRADEMWQHDRFQPDSDGDDAANGAGEEATNTTTNNNDNRRRNNGHPREARRRYHEDGSGQTASPRQQRRRRGEDSEGANANGQASGDNDSPPVRSRDEVRSAARERFSERDSDDDAEEEEDDEVAAVDAEGASADALRVQLPAETEAERARNNRLLDELV